MTAPVLFISHGSPTFALEPGALGARLTEVGQRLSGVRAVLVVSPHWQTRGVGVMTTPRPETVHDFGGFPRALHELQYPAAGAPDLALRAAHLLQAAGLPVFQVSLPHDLDAAGALRLGQALAPLREAGVMIIGSGSMTHNLYELQREDGPPAPHVQAFTAWMRQATRARDLRALADYRRLAPEAPRAHPTDEHLLPLQVAVGASADDDDWQILGDEVRYQTLSMESYAWGLEAGRSLTA